MTAIDKIAEAFWTGGPHSRAWPMLAEHERELLRARTRTALDAARHAETRCRWEEDEIDGCWETDCGESWAFTDGGPDENKVRFCHFCGREVEPVRHETEDAAA